MSVMENFSAGLLVTGLGMGLVFLTLVIVMYCIKLLDWAFRPKEAVATPAPKLATVAASAPAATEVVSGASTDEIAAIAVAIALAKAKAQPAPVVWSAPGPVSAFDIDYENEISGEVVTVTSIDAGPGTYKGYGRLKALQ